MTLQDWLARKIEGAAQTKQVRRELKDVTGLVQKSDAARRDFGHDVDQRLEALARQVGKLAERLDRLAEREDQRHDKHEADLKDRRLETETIADRLAPLVTEVPSLRSRVDALDDFALGTDRMAPLLRSLEAIDEPFPPPPTPSLCSARLETDPSAHVVVDEVLPRPLYDLLLATIPPPLCFEWKDHTKSDFRPFGGPAAPMLSRIVWQPFDREVVGRTLRDTLLGIFQPVIRPHYAEVFGEAFADTAASMPMEASGRLMRRLPGYHLEPHLDPKRVLITGIVYFGRRGDSERYGTSFYRVSERFVASYAKTFYPQEAGLRCELAKAVDFKANRLVAFINSGAAHGADIPKDAPQADRYAFQFYIAPQDAALRGLIDQLPPDRRDHWESA